MHVKIIFVLLTVSCQHVRSDMNSTKDSATFTPLPKTSMKVPSRRLSSEQVEENPMLKSLWVNHPNNHISPPIKDVELRNVILREPHLLTRLAKSLTYDYDPFFKKGYFEPFERRPKPVTLLAFRRNKLIPRQNIKDSRFQRLHISYNLGEKLSSLHRSMRPYPVHIIPASSSQRFHIGSNVKSQTSSRYQSMPTGGVGKLLALPQDSLEIAEMQSPFNSVSEIWQEEN